MGKDAEMDETLDKITVEQDGISYLVEIKGIEYAHFEVEHIIANTPETKTIKIEPATKVSMFSSLSQIFYA